MQLHKLIVIIFIGQVLGDSGKSEAHPREKREEIIDVIIDKVKHFVKYGSKFLNMTSLDPYHNALMKIHVNDDELKIHGELIDVTINGLANFDVTKYDLSILKAKTTMDIIFPKLTSVGYYNLSYNSQSHNAIGKYDITLEDVKFTAHAKFALLSKDGVTFTSFDNVKLEKISLTTVGEYNGQRSNLKIVKDSSASATEFANRYHIVDFFVHKCLTYMNQRLAGKSLWALRKFFKST